ncbi:MAG: hypothetical protein AAGD40_03075 [Pseudomonadota bacterium]
MKARAALERAAPAAGRVTVHERHGRVRVPILKDWHPDPAEIIDAADTLPDGANS